MRLQDASELKLEGAIVHSAILNDEVLYDTNGLGYVEYTGQDITAHNSRAGKPKSAILSGDTLVNLINKTTTYPFTISESEIYRDIDLAYPLNANSVYTIIVTITGVPATKNYFGFVNNGWASTLGYYGSGGTVVAKVTSNEQMPKKLRLYGENSIISKILILEGDYTNSTTVKNQPQFTGMSSAKLPVLTVDNGNIFDGVFEYGNISTSTGGIVASSTVVVNKNKYIKVSPSSNYIHSEPTKVKQVAFYDKDKNFINAIFVSSSHFTTPLNAHYINFTVQDTTPDILIQLERGTVRTTYKSPKSSILKPLESITLGGVGTVKDTFNALTGEVVENTQEVVFDGNEDSWTNMRVDLTPDNLAFTIPLENTYYTTNIGIVKQSFIENLGFVQNTISITVNDARLNGIRSFSRHSNGNIYFSIPKNELSSPNVDGWKDFLVKNNMTFRYRVETPTIKTVDLSGDLLSYEGTTHYTCGTESDNSLIPTATIQVPSRIPQGLAAHTLQLKKEGDTYVNCTSTESIRCVE